VRPSAPTARQLARSVLDRIARTRAFPNRVLSAALDRAAHLSSADRALTTELVYGVLRREARLDRALESLATRGLRDLDPRVRTALRVAAYQVLFLDRVPPYAAVNDGVEACKAARGRGMAGLANALLRRLVDRGEPPLPGAAEDPLGHLVEASGLPEWLARLALAELPDGEAIPFVEALSRPAPLALRANTLRTDRATLRARLLQERPNASLDPSPIAADALLARHIDAPFATAAWKEGLFGVEDVGAQVVGDLCGAAAGEHIWDACAGLGGKTAHLAALAGNRATIDATDIAPRKLAQARETWSRLHVKGVTTRARDLMAAPAEPPRFHRVLVDAPCSGLGVLRRHPEAAARRDPADIAALAARQRLMLGSAAAAVLPGGSLVYAVCTFDRAECDDVIAAFLDEHADFRVEPPAGARWDGLRDWRGFVRTWPHRHDADAFFAVRLRRQE